MAAKLLKMIRSPQVMLVHLRVYVSLMQVQDTGIVWIILLCTFESEGVLLLTSPGNTMYRQTMYLCTLVLCVLSVCVLSLFW